jgi:hypothetical protein
LNRAAFFSLRIGYQIKRVRGSSTTNRYSSSIAVHRELRSAFLADLALQPLHHSNRIPKELGRSFAYRIVMFAGSQRAKIVLASEFLDMPEPVNASHGAVPIWWLNRLIVFGIAVSSF